jgi:hypothetical protein
MTIVQAIILNIVWTVSLAALLFALRNYFGAWFKKRAEHGFDKKLEEFRYELEQRQAKWAQLIEGALTTSAARRLALENRRLLAVERLWDNFVALQPLKFTSGVMARVKFEETAKAAPTSEKIQRLFATFGKTISPESMSIAVGNKERPFLPETVWAYFYAYSAIVHFSAVQLKSLEFGFDGSGSLQSEPIAKLIVAAIPEYAAYVAENGSAGFHYILDSLEDRLLAALRDMLEGKEVGPAQLAVAKSIMEEADKLQVVTAATAAQV